MTPDAFVKTVLELGLLTARELEPVLERLHAASQPITTDALARTLVDQSMLTRYQARKIWNDKAGSLVLGNYVLLDRIGQGGMGTVYKARHRWMQRVVAIKVIEVPEVNESGEIRKRFQREVRAAARLSHPNIVTAFDADQFGETFFLVMEFVEGRDLATEVAQQGALSVAKSVACILQAARGLGHAHAQGIVHRDIKPRNLLLADSGLVKILDLGLARSIDSQLRIDDSHSIDPSQGLGVLGTVDYMSPEQAEDPSQVVAQSDLYSLGCTLFFLLTGHAPFERESWFDTLVAHQSQLPPRLSEYRSDLPAGLQEVLDKMMAKLPCDRFASMTELIDALTTFDTDSDFQLRDDLLDESEPDQGSETRIFDSNLLKSIQAGSKVSIADTQPIPLFRGVVLGVDLGADSLRMATLDKDRKPASIPNVDGSLATPSALFVTPKQEVLTGIEAFSAIEHDARHGLERVSNLLVDPATIRPIYGQRVPAEVALSLLLSRIKSDARARIGASTLTLLSTPHAYDDRQRVALLDAARLAQLTEPALVDELSAAALAYLYLSPHFSDSIPADGAHWMVVQIGACNTAIGVMQMHRPVVKTLATLADSALGGRQWDQALIDYAADAYQKRFGHDPRKSLQCSLVLGRRCEAAKRALSREQEVQIEVQGDEGAARVQMTRTRFQRHTAPLVSRLTELCRHALSRAGLEWSDLDRVVLSGGATRMPTIRRTLAQLFGKEPKSIPFPDESLAMGAALHALSMSANGHLQSPLSVQPIPYWSLGIILPSASGERNVFSEIMPSGVPLPASAAKTFRLRKAGAQTVSLILAQAAPSPLSERRILGRLIVRVIDSNLPAGTPIELRFHQLADARIGVEGTIGSAACVVEIDRMNNLKESELQHWNERLRQGTVFESDEIGLVED